MAKLNVNIGLSVNDKTGDTLRTAFDKINQNFTELYTLTGGTSTALTELAQDYAAPLFNHANHTNITATYDDANNKILLTGAAAVWPVTNTAGASGPREVAIGSNAGTGSYPLSTDTVAIGTNAGRASQGAYAVAVGKDAGNTVQGMQAVAIGLAAAESNQGANAVAVGRLSGNFFQGANAVAVGNSAGATSQAANTIILNATGSAVNGVAAQTNSFYVAPIRTDATPGNVLFYNTTTKEITYGTAPSTTVSSLVNGAKTVSLDSGGNLTFADAGSTFFGSGFLQSGTSGTNIGIKSWDGRQKVFVNETNVTVQAVNNSSQAYNWTFGTDGSTQFPSNTVKSAADTALAITTGESVDATQIYNRYTDFSADVTIGGIGYIGGWYQRNAQQIEFALFGPSAFATYLTGVAVGRTMTVVYETSGGYPNQFTGTVTQAFTNQGQYDPAHPTWVRVSGRVDGTLPSNTGIRSIGFPLSNIVPHTWTFGTDGKLTAPGNLEVDGGRIILHPYGNAYVESVDYGVNSANSAVNIFGGPYQKIKLRAGFGTQATWTFGTDGTLTFPNATVQSTAYVAPTTGNSIIDSINLLTISRNGMTIRVTSAGMIQMSFNSVITITGRSSINNADSAVISSPNGATTSGTWYNIGAVLAAGDHLTATIVDSSFHRIYRLTAIIREKGTTPGSEFATAYAIIEQLQ